MQCFVCLVHLGLDLVRQGVQVVLGSHVLRLDRVENLQHRIAGVEDQRTGLRYAIGAFDDDGKKGKSSVYGDPKGPLVKRQKRAIGRTRSLGEDDQRIPPFCGRLDPFGNGLSRRATFRPVDLDNPDRRHCAANERDLEEFRLGKESAIEREKADESWDIEQREVIRDDDVAPQRIDLLDAGEFSTNRRNSEPQTRPIPEDVVMDRRSWSERAINDDERRNHHREDEEQRDKHERSDSREQRARHDR